jgi:hypothetical protein
MGRITAFLSSLRPLEPPSYEYKVESTVNELDRAATQNHLNGLGEAGWELVAVTMTSFYFKRQV